MYFYPQLSAFHACRCPHACRSGCNFCETHLCLCCYHLKHFSLPTVVCGQRDTLICAPLTDLLPAFSARLHSLHPFCQLVVMIRFLKPSLHILPPPQKKKTLRLHVALDTTREYTALHQTLLYFLISYEFWQGVGNFDAYLFITFWRQSTTFA